LRERETLTNSANGNWQRQKAANRKIKSNQIESNPQKAGAAKTQFICE